MYIYSLLTVIWPSIVRPCGGDAKLWPLHLEFEFGPMSVRFTLVQRFGQPAEAAEK
jgi:hypothetical protein